MALLWVLGGLVVIAGIASFVLHSEKRRDWIFGRGDGGGLGGWDDAAGSDSGSEGGTWGDSGGDGGGGDGGGGGGD